MDAREYIVSERIIHDDLQVKAALYVNETYKMAKEGKETPSYIIVWPSEHLQADDGTIITHQVVQELTQARSEWNKALIDMVKLCKAYGVLLVESSAKGLEAWFETHHGAFHWRMDKLRSGGDVYYDKPIVSEDEECLGVLWSPRKANS